MLLYAFDPDLVALGDTTRRRRVVIVQQSKLATLSVAWRAYPGQRSNLGRFAYPGGGSTTNYNLRLCLYIDSWHGATHYTKGYTDGQYS